MTLEKMAAAGAEMPDGLDMADQLLYLTLRELYSNFRAGAVNRERGSREKKRIMIAYEKLKADYKIMDHHLKLRRRLEHEIGNLYKCGCENCRHLINVFTGIDRRDIPEDVTEVHQWNEKLRELVRQRSDRASELATQLDRVRWALDGEGTAEERLEKIKEVLKQ